MNKTLSIKTLIIWMLAATVLLGLMGFIALYFLNLESYSEDISALSDAFNTTLGLPVAIVGTFLAFYLALTAYNLSKSESERESVSLFHTKNGEASRLFVSISIRLGRLISISDISVIHFQRLYEKVHENDYLKAMEYDHVNLDEEYSHFFCSVQTELQRLGFISELKALEEDLTELLADPVASELFNSKLVTTSLPSIITSVRGWGSLITSSKTNLNHIQFGEDLYNHLRAESLLELFSYEPQNAFESSYFIDRSQFGDLLIDSKIFSLIFFASLLDSRKIVSEPLIENDYMSLDTNEHISIEQRLSTAKQWALEARLRRRYEIIDGLGMLSEIISAIPNNEELADSYANAIGIKQTELRNQITIGINPYAILDRERIQLQEINIKLGGISPKRFLSIESDFFPVNYHRYVFQ